MSYSKLNSCRHWPTALAYSLLSLSTSDIRARVCACCWFALPQTRVRGRIVASHTLESRCANARLCGYFEFVTQIRIPGH